MNIRTQQFAAGADDHYWHTVVFIKELIIPFDLHHPRKQQFHLACACVQCRARGLKVGHVCLTWHLQLIKALAESGRRKFIDCRRRPPTRSQNTYSTLTYPTRSMGGEINPIILPSVSIQFKLCLQGNSGFVLFQVTI